MVDAHAAEEVRGQRAQRRERSEDAYLQDHEGRGGDARLGRGLVGIVHLNHIITRNMYGVNILMMTAPGDSSRFRWHSTTGNVPEIDRL